MTFLDRLYASLSKPPYVEGGWKDQLGEEELLEAFGFLF
jgi:hypothetical protein